MSFLTVSSWLLFPLKPIPYQSSSDLFPRVCISFFSCSLLWVTRMYTNPYSSWVNSHSFLWVLSLSLQRKSHRTMTTDSSVVLWALTTSRTDFANFETSNQVIRLLSLSVLSSVLAVLVFRFFLFPKPRSVSPQFSSDTKFLLRGNPDHTSCFPLPGISFRTVFFSVLLFLQLTKSTKMQTCTLHERGSKTCRSCLCSFLTKEE